MFKFGIDKRSSLRLTHLKKIYAEILSETELMDVTYLPTAFDSLPSIVKILRCSIN